MLSVVAVCGVLAQVGTTVSAASGATTTSDCSGVTPPPKANGAAWTCMFDDEFSSSTLGPAWVPTQTSQTGVATGAGSYRGCYVNSSNNISVSHGALQLTVRKERSAFTCSPKSGAFSTYYTAGSVSTVGKFWQTYGRFSIRARMPDSNDKGLQETLWLWPVNSVKYANYGSAACEPTGEIDIAELYSAWPSRNFPYVHYCYDPKTVNRSTGVNTFNAMPAPNNQPGTDCSFDYEDWNLFTLDWQPGVLTVYVNNKTCLVDHYQPSGGLASPAPFDSPFFIALTQGLGVTLSNSDNGASSRTMIPATTQVDYVRVWK